MSEIWSAAKDLAEARVTIIPLCAPDHHCMPVKHCQTCKSPGKTPLIEEIYINYMVEYRKIYSFIYCKICLCTRIWWRDYNETRLCTWLCTYDL
ncbi:hypothetical protein Ga0466249_005088 [Sporomusaceae bacterium BoRhaA]|nr:hypothetical protein [Pelorhabdus rhamnosifermentans]